MTSFTKSKSKSTNNSDDTPLLTIADIHELKEDLEADQRLLKDLPRRIEQKKAKLEAALLFAPDSLRQQKGRSSVEAASKPQMKSQRPKVSPASPAKSTPKAPASVKRIIRARNGKKTWTSAILKVLEAAKKGLSHRELRAGLENAGMSGRLAKSDKGFYSGIAKLVRTGQAVRSGGMLYAHDVATELQKSGKPLPDKTVETRQRGSTALVADVLRKFPEGLNGQQLQELVSARPDAPQSIRDHRHYIYNILNGLVKSGRVTKADSKYRLAPEKSEANGVGSTVGFEAHA